MASELGASIQKTLKDRVSSPLYGSFIISWLIINWQIPYVTIFESNTTLAQSKISFIKSYLQTHDFQTIWVPICTTLILVTLGPLFSYWALLLPENFRHKRVNYRAELQKDELINRFSEENKNKDQKILILTAAQQQHSQSLSGIKILTDVFQGRWRLRRTINGNFEYEIFFISQGDLYVKVTGDIGSETLLQEHQLESVSFYNDKSLTFTKRPLASGVNQIYSVYKISEKLFEGHENQTIPVQIEKIKDTRL
jgi:hypothetical protein